MLPSLIDSHCHLDMAPYSHDLDQVLQRARGQGVDRIVTVGVDLASSRRAVDLASRLPGVYATVGIHPHDAASIEDEDYEYLRSLAGRPGVVGFGEIGLDFAKLYAPAEVQLRHFVRLVQLGRETGLPLIIHDRDAHDQVMAILEDNGPYGAGGVMHCFSGDRELARRVLDLGFYLSIPGIVTFASAATLREVVRFVPLDRLLVETDGPYLAPVPFRGKRNEPAYLVHTARQMAELKEVSMEELAAATTANAERLFRLPPYAGGGGKR